MRNLFAIWFAFRGRISGKEFWLIGIVPGLLLGSCLLRIDAEFNLQGGLFIPFFLFSLWPTAALTTKYFRRFWRVAV